MRSPKLLVGARKAVPSYVKTLSVFAHSVWVIAFSPNQKEAGVSCSLLLRLASSFSISSSSNKGLPEVTILARIRRKRSPNGILFAAFF